MTLTNLDKAPFPWFGGKSKAAPEVWAALGDVPHYVEPFAGSLAVLLNRPHLANRPYHSETVNDLDGMIVNAWRSIQLSPEATADAASWPVSEADLHARHCALVKWRNDNELEHIMGDPAWHDPIMAGWWLWGIACWIGSGWVAGHGAWWPDETGRLVKNPRTAREPGVDRTRPHLDNNGVGVNRPAAREPGIGEPHPVTMPELVRWFQHLAARLRHVRIINGDWKRVVTTGAAWTLPVRQDNGPAGVLLDPPYADTANRDDGLYAIDSLTVAHDCREWAISVAHDPKWRIVFAGFDGEHGTAFTDAGWTEIEWYKAGHLAGGMGNTGKDGHQQKLERLWLSPHCLTAKGNSYQQDLFGGAA